MPRQESNSKDLLSASQSPSRQLSNFAMSSGPFTPVNMHSMFFSPRGLISNELLATIKTKVNGSSPLLRKSTHDCYLAALANRKNQHQKNEQLRKEIASELFDNKKEQEEEDWMRTSNYLARQVRGKQASKNHHYLFQNRHLKGLRGAE